MSRKNRRAAQDLILVAGHAAFRQEVVTTPEQPERDTFWALQPFQAGEPPFYIEHIRRGVVLAANNPEALLVFSGGRTRAEAGPWSEAETYFRLAQAAGWWIPPALEALQTDVAARVAKEAFARDSLENLLFGLCRFYQETGRFPRGVTVVGWAFKEARFQLHRAALRYPAWQFRYDGFNLPLRLEEAQRGEYKTLREFVACPYGARGPLAAKRAARDPFGQGHPYAETPGLQEFFAFLAAGGEDGSDFPGALPWEVLPRE